MAVNSSIFLRGGAETPPGGSGGPGYSIRSNAQASVGFAGGGPSSPILATNAGNGRPSPTLNYVKVTLEGTAGSLRRGTFQVTCFDAGSFNDVIAAEGIGGIGKEITISINRSGPGAGGGMSHQFRVYKNEFNTSKEGKFIVTVFAVGKGMEIMKKDGLKLGPKAGLFFYKNPDSILWPFPEKIPVTGMMDYFLWYITNKTAKMFPFSPEPNACEQGKFFTLVAPTGYTPPANAPGFSGGVGKRNRLAYINLRWLIDYMNDALPPGPKLDLIAECNDTVDKAGTPLLSKDPTRLIIPRGDKYSDYAEEKVAMTDLIFSLLGTPSKIGTSFLDPVPTAVSGKNADVGLFYISYDALRAIEQSLTGGADSAKAGEDEAKFDNSGTKMTAEGFLSGVFSLIAECTGGAVDLTTSEDPKAFDSGDLESNVLIVNKKAVQDAAGPTTYDDVSGEGGVRSATFSGKVPKGWQQVAFAGGNVGAELAAKSLGPTPKEQIDKAMASLEKDGYDAAPMASIGAALRQAQDETPAPDKGKVQNRAYPIGLSLKVNGIAGIGFGHAIQMSSLSSTRWGGDTPTLFTVTRVTHQVQNQDWTTDIETVARLSP
tara:strand:+ start:701 stop:2500 length:1800 start_codon:yes stop_codon:yes gene_type:complete